MANPRILLVEDDVDLRTLFRITLQTAGYSVKEAVDGLEAIGLLQVERFDGVILDLAMPRLDGVSVLDTFNRMREKGSVPILVCSALSDPKIEKHMREAGAVAFLQKPLRPQELVTAVREYVPLPDITAAG